MDPFEKFDIKHLSPSSINLYAANPSLWVGRYLFQWRDDFGAAAFRGTAIEAGLDLWLFERNLANATMKALATFAELTGGQADDEHEAERANIAPMLQQATLALKDMGKPVARQVRVEHYVNGVEVPLIGFVDYLWEDFGLDLKTTKACPSAIKADHGRQVATYSAARNRPFKVLYVTAKKHALYDLAPVDAEIHLRDTERLARAIRHLLKKSDDADDAAHFFAPERSDFRWNETLLGKADELWRAA